jgi:Peptidase family M1 domain
MEYVGIFGHCIVCVGDRFGRAFLVWLSPRSSCMVFLFSFSWQLEYDLDLYNIVAVDNFNMGAMENKSLNVFNTAYVLADQATATDTDFERVEAVIGHEYFHNWTGNRVTCRTYRTNAFIEILV